MLNCAVGAVSEQCVEDTGERMRALGERVILNIGCAGQSRKRLYIRVFKQYMLRIPVDSCYNVFSRPTIWRQKVAVWVNK